MFLVVDVRLLTLVWGGANYPIFLLEDRAINVWYIESPTVHCVQDVFWPTPPGCKSGNHAWLQY